MAKNPLWLVSHGPSTWHHWSSPGAWFLRKNQHGKEATMSHELAWIILTMWDPPHGAVLQPQSQHPSNACLKLASETSAWKNNEELYMSCPLIEAIHLLPLLRNQGCPLLFHNTKAAVSSRCLCSQITAMCYASDVAHDQPPGRGQRYAACSSLLIKSTYTTENTWSECAVIIHIPKSTILLDQNTWI